MIWRKITLALLALILVLPLLISCTKEQQREIFMNELDKILRIKPKERVPNVTLPAPAAWQEKTYMITSWHGRVEISRPPSYDWLPVRNGTEVYTGDNVRTLEGGAYEMQGNSGFLLKVGHEDSMLSVPSKDKPLEKGVSGYLEFIKGRFWMMINFVEQQNSNFQFRTPNAIAGVKGTELEIIVQSNGTTVNVLKGAIEVSDLSRTRTLSIKAGEGTTCTGNSGPSAVTRYRPDSVGQWWENTDCQLGCQR